MKQELKRIEPWRAANIGALVYGLLLSAFVLIFLPFLLAALLFAPSEETGLTGPSIVLLVLVLYPVLGVVMGWISGLLTSVIYNFIIRWSGGLLLEFDPVGPVSGDGAA